jgi:hypothetical protein
MNAQTRCPDTERWNDLLEGRIADAEQAGLSAHLEGCRDCQRTLESLTVVDAAWPDAARGAQHAIQPALRSVMDKLKAGGDTALETIGLATVGDASLAFLRPPLQPEHLGRIGAYEVLDVIGRGGMGVVLKAFDPALGRLTAIKVLAPQLATNAAARERFAREARHTAQVRHENVVAIYAVDEVDGLPYLVMEYVPGMSLQQHLDETGPLQLEEILRIGMQAAYGLAAAHAEGLIHRDIKPGNILLDQAGNVKLTDFGLARAVDDASLTQAGVIAGTPQYMAPEQARGAPLDHRADLFSLGSVLYVMATGRPPFRAPTTLAVLKRVCEETPAGIRAINRKAPDWLAEIIDKLHAKNPGDRFQSADEVARLLRDHWRHVLAPATARKPRPLAPPRPARSRKRWALAFAAVAALSVLIFSCAGLAYWITQPPHHGGDGGKDEPQLEVVDDEVFAKVRAELDFGDVFTRRDALRRLARMKPNDKRAEVAKTIAELTELDDPHIRRPAVIALGTWATAKEVPALIKAIDHPDVFTQRDALKVVGGFRDKRALAPVMRRFRDNLTRADAAVALRAMGPMTEADTLALLKDDNVFLKKDAIAVLADIGTDASVPTLREQMGSGNVFVVEPARKALAAIAARKKN